MMTRGFCCSSRGREAAVPVSSTCKTTLLYSTRCKSAIVLNACGRTHLARISNPRLSFPDVPKCNSLPSKPIRPSQLLVLSRNKRDRQREGFSWVVTAMHGRRTLGTCQSLCLPYVLNESLFIDTSRRVFEVDRHRRMNDLVMAERAACPLRSLIGRWFLEEQFEF